MTARRRSHERGLAVAEPHGEPARTCWSSTSAGLMFEAVTRLDRTRPNRTSAASRDGCGSECRAVGFWQHVVEKRLPLKTKTASKRAPSIIVYTPSGYVGVYVPPTSWGKRFALSPQGPATLERFFDLAPSGNEVNLRFPATRNQQGQEMTTLVTMKRLSGEQDMLQK